MMTIKDQLDAELALARELLGPVRDITLYKDKYEELCKLLEQDEIQIYQGTRVYCADENSTDAHAHSDST